jgi:hypothetical protein
MGFAALATFVSLLVWGSHAVVPWHLRNGVAAALGPRSAAGGAPVPAAGVRWWRLLAAASGLLALLLTLLVERGRPDAAVAVLGAGGPFVLASRLAASILLAILLFDVVVLLLGDRFDRPTWALAGACGLAALLAWSILAELLRIGGTAVGPLPALGVATGCRFVLGLAAGRTFATDPPRADTDPPATPSARRPFASRLLDFVALLAVPGYLSALPPELRRLLLDQGFLVTGAAAIAGFALAALLPARSARLARLVATLLAAVLLGAATELASLLPPPTPLLRL